MKIIHTFFPIWRDINKEIIYQMTLSVILAKKHYDKVVLYTTANIAKIVKEIGLPYDEINDKLLEGIETRTFSIPKLIVYAAQTEPFIHLDIDAFIFKKIEFDEIDKIYATYNEGANTIRVDTQGLAIFNAYLLHTFEIQNNLPERFASQIDFSNIANMSIFGGYDYELIANASYYCLNIYDLNRMHFDKIVGNASIIEQLFIPAAIRMVDKNIEFRYLYESIPTSINFSPGSENHGDWNYPFDIISNKEKFSVKNIIDLDSCSEYDFNGFLHLCWYKYFDKFLYVIKLKIMSEVNGPYFLEKIDKLFS